jgi:tryptophan synthase alpha subunit
MPRKTFTAGDVLSAADVNTYLMNQAVMTFADSTARGLAIATAIEGMVSYLEDSNKYQYYTGSAWADLVPIPVIENTTINAAYTAIATNAGGFIYSTASSNVTVNIPDLYQVGDRIDIIRDGAGTVTIVAGTGVSSWAGVGVSGTANTFKIDQQYNGATVLKVAAGSYRVIGKIVS